MSLLEDAHKSFKGLVNYPPKEFGKQLTTESLPPQLNVMDQSIANTQLPPADISKLQALYAPLNTPPQLTRSGQPFVDEEKERKNKTPQLNATDIELAMEEEAYGAPRQEGWKLGDTYTRLNSLFGANVSDASIVKYGVPSGWKEFGKQLTTVFDEFGLKVDQNRFFPAPIYLDEGGEGMTPTKEMEGLEKRRLANTGMNPQHGWSLNDAGKLHYGMTIRSADQYRKSIGNPNTPPLGDNAYAGISNRGVLESLGVPAEIIPAQAPNFEQQIIPAQPPTRSTPWHEYGHILDRWAADGESLSVIATTLDIKQSPHRDLIAHDYYVAWMNDPRTAKLDVVDKINTADHPNQKLNNPREILGKLFATAIVNPTRIDGQHFDPVPPHSNNMQENIARAIGKFFNPDQTQDEGHIQGIKDMRSNVIGAIANLLNQ